MKGTTMLLLALLVLAIPGLVMAQVPGGNETGTSEEDIVTDETGLEGGEDADISSSSTRPRIHALAVLGKGIAVTPGSPMDFMLAKVGLGAVRVTVDGKSKRVAVGVLKLDGVRYRIRNVSVVDGHATGLIYKNGSQAGSFDMSSVQKDRVEVWAGTMELNGEGYQLYIIAGVRRIKPAELRDKVADYCRNNPDDTNCRDKVEQYCENNPNDSRCKAIFRKYCIAGRNMDDTRCREYVRSYCTENSTLRECVTLGINRARAFCEENPDSTLCRKIDNTLVDFCRENPENEGCVRATELLRNRSQVLQRLRDFVKKRISELRPADTSSIPELENVNVVGEEGG